MVFREQQTSGRIPAKHLTKPRLLYLINVENTFLHQRIIRKINEIMYEKHLVQSLPCVALFISDKSIHINMHTYNLFGILYSNIMNYMHIHLHTHTLTESKVCDFLVF